jgi:hypothetical protein
MIARTSLAAAGALVALWVGLSAPPLSGGTIMAAIVLAGSWAPLIRAAHGQTPKESR